MVVIIVFTVYGVPKLFSRLKLNSQVFARLQTIMLGTQKYCMESLEMKYIHLRYLRTLQYRDQILSEIRVASTSPLFHNLE